MGDSARFRLARVRGEHVEVAALWKEALIVSSELEHSWSVLRALAGLAGAAGLAADHERAARLFGAVEALREAGGTREHRQWRAVYEPDVAAVRDALGEAAFAAAWAEGREMSMQQAITYALGEAASV